MTKRRKYFLGIVCILLLIITFLFLYLQYQNKKSQTILNLTTEQKLADYNELCRILDESYPFFLEAKQAGIDKKAIYAKYQTNIEKTQTDIAYFKELNYFLKEFGGLGHISLLDGYMYKMYIDTFAIGNDMLTFENAQTIKPLAEVLNSPSCQTTYGLLDQSHSGFRSIIGLKSEYQNAEILNEETITTEASLITTKILQDKETAYLKIPSFQLTYYSIDEAVLSNFFSEIMDIPNLIIDVRGNSGGSDLYWQNLLVKPNASHHLTSERYFLCNPNETTGDYIAAKGLIPQSLAASKDSFLSNYTDSFSSYVVDTTSFEAATNPYKGKIWVLTDADVYSASENFVMFCKNTGFATLVGSQTGGDGGIADPMLFALPNSGLIVRFSIFYGLNADGSGNEATGTTPDILISEGEDALEKCLNMIEK